MKILFYISTIRGGGAARVMTNLANQFAAEKNEIIFVTNFSESQEYPLNSTVCRHVLEAQESREHVLLKNGKRIYKLRRLIKKYMPDVVVSFMHENDVRAYIATCGLPTKLLLSVRNDPKELYKSRLKGRIAKYIYGHASAVVFQTVEAKAWFENIAAKNQIIYNQVAPEFYEINRNVKTGKDIVTTGKFMHQKNHKMLIEAFGKIANQIEDNLIIYGDGILRKEYEQYIAEKGLEKRIFLPGNCSNVAETIAGCKLFIMSSNYEGMPNSLMEAMAVGLPCISTDCPCGGPKELAGESESVDLVAVGDTEKLAEKMLYYVQNEEYANKKARLAKERAEYFRPEYIYSQWKSFIEEIYMEQ